MYPRANTSTRSLENVRTFSERIVAHRTIAQNSEYYQSQVYHQPAHSNNIFVQATRKHFKPVRGYKSLETVAENIEAGKRNKSFIWNST